MFTVHAAELCGIVCDSAALRAEHVRLFFRGVWESLFEILTDKIADFPGRKLVVSAPEPDILGDSVGCLRVRICHLTHNLRSLWSRNFAFLAADRAETAAGSAFSVLVAAHITDFGRIVHADLFVFAVSIEFFCHVVVVGPLQVLADKISISSGSRLIGLALEPYIVTDIFLCTDKFGLTHVSHS